MKRVMLVGDSIRMNYCPVVYMKLSEFCEVVYPEENSRFAKYTLCEFGHWVEKYGIPDIIHWNNGLWDVFRYDGEHILTPLDDYLADMKRVYARMKQTGAKIIFATSTPTSPYDTDRRQEDIVEYNKAITDWLKTKDVEINDLYSFLKPHVFEYISEDSVHLNKYGVREVGNRVVEVIKKHL